MAELPAKKRKNYVRSLKAYCDRYSIMEAERTEGRAEGRAEERLAVAINLKRLGANIGMMAQATGISPDVISTL